MKKIIISIMTVAFGVMLTTTAVHADASFNNTSGLPPVISVDNVTDNPCSFGAVDGCWKTSTTAKPGDEIAAQVAFANTSSETAKNVTISLQPSRNGTLVSFGGGAAATNANRVTGNATVTLSQTETITELGGDQRADWRTNTNSTPQEVDITSLFGSSGFSVGDVAPGEEVMLTVRFIVNGTANVTPPPAASCQINNFSASPTSIPLGSTSALSWTTSNCNYVNITQVGTNLATDNSGYTVTPTNTTTYTLTAYPDGGTATATVTVTNNGGGGGNNNTCTINSFNASPNSITSGSSSSLNWSTTNCNYVNVTSIGNNLATNSNGYPVYPANTTTYTLTAFPGGSTATTTVTVNTVTNNSCYINNFSASPSSITYGGSSNLNWTTTNCNYVTISTINGNQSTNGNVSVYPYNTTTYTLTAFPGGTTSTVTVNVYNQGNTNYCSITSFYVDSNSITQGSSTVLHWITSGANSVYISGFGSENASGAIPISPYSSTTYTLSLNGSNCSGNQSQSVYVTVSQPIQIQQTGEQPQAITTVASVLSSYSAQLNGIAVPNNQYGTTTAWFEYGSSTALGNTTSPQAINAGLGTNPYSGNISGLAPGGTYYYRAVVQNQYGTAYGSIVPFSIPAAQSSYVYTPPTRVIVQSRTVSTGYSGLVANSTASLFKLEVDSNFDHMCIGGNLSYTVNYQNISNQTLQNSVLRITFPGELTYASSSEGDYDDTDRTLTIALGDVQPGQTGSVTVNAEVNSNASIGKLAVITATMVYTNPRTQAQEQAIAYSLITVSNDCPSVLGASVFGFGSFLPQTLLAWLLLILIILALIVLARTLTKKNEQAK